LGYIQADSRALDKGLESRRHDNQDASKRDSIIGRAIANWFKGIRRVMVETTYPSQQAKRLLEVVAGSANDQFVYRAVLSLATMVTPEFREMHGLVTQSGATLNGEDRRQKGWLMIKYLFVSFVTTWQSGYKPMRFTRYIGWPLWGACAVRN
jgi:hypothetical protein